MNIGKSIDFIHMKFLVDDSLGLGFPKMSLVLVYHKNCCLGCIVIGGVFFLGGDTSYLKVNNILDGTEVQQKATTFLIVEV